MQLAAEMEHQQRKELFAASDAALVLEDDRRHVNRLQKPPLSPIHIHEQHVSGPEDDDDFIIDRDVLGPIGKKRDSNNNNTQLTLPAASVTQHHHHPLPPPPALSQPRTRLYPWLDEHSSKRIDQQRETNVIRSEPTRHGYNTTSANPTSTDHSNVNTSEHQSVRTRLLPPSRPSTGHDFWRAVTNPGTITATTAAYGSSSNNSRRHSILRFGSKRRPQNERNMKKSASVEFKLHDGAHLLKHASSDAKPFSGLTLGRDMPRYVHYRTMLY